jgi:mannose-6-phosphate isomerase-like protein (cupin superfamily)
MKVIHEADIADFLTKDGSRVREIAHPDSSGARAQSLARAAVAAGAETEEHFHRASEEVYLFTSGKGRMRLGSDEADVAAGDAVVIPPGTPHKLWASAEGELVLLCMCSPPYSDDDTELTGRP